MQTCPVELLTLLVNPCDAKFTYINDLVLNYQAKAQNVLWTLLIIHVYNYVFCFSTAQQSSGNPTNTQSGDNSLVGGKGTNFFKKCFLNFHFYN